MFNRIYFITTLSLSFIALILTGCPPKKPLVIEDDEEPAIEEVMDTEEDVDQAMEEDNEIEITQEWAEIPALQTVHFDYDRSSLTSNERIKLKNNVAIIKKLPSSVMIRLAGHCDERGTIEYNIALGQRRANVVRDFYKTAGIASARLKTISYGEERPLCTQPTDACWLRNRRVDTQVRNPEVLTVDTETLK